MTNLEKLLACIVGELPENVHPRVSHYPSVDDALAAFITFVECHASGILGESAKLIARVATKNVAARLETSTKAALESKDLGNAFMKAGDFANAIRQYTVALAYMHNNQVCTASCEASDSHCRIASTILSNRSAAWIGFGAFLHALEDADAAVLLDSQYAKAWYRRSQALEKLSSRDLELFYGDVSGDSFSAAIAAHTALALQCGPSDGTRASNDSALRLSLKIRSSHSQQRARAPAAGSPLMCVKDNPVVGGRGTYSTSDHVILPGTVIFSEEACVSVWLIDGIEPQEWLCGSKEWRCEHCLKRVESPQVLPLAYVLFKLVDCSRPYCSVHCWVASNPASTSPQIARTISLLGGDAALALQLLASTRLTHLRGHVLEHDSASLIRLASFASLIRKSLAEIGVTQLPSTPQLCEALCVVECNAHALKEVRFSGDDKQLVSTLSDDAYAVGLFEQGSLLNHSCQPSCVTRFAGKRMEVVAIRPIVPHEEITISYGPDTFTDILTEARQTRLLERYHFMCRCAGCQIVVDRVQLEEELHRVGVASRLVSPRAILADASGVFSAITECEAGLHCAAAWRLLGRQLDDCAQQLVAQGGTMQAARCTSESIACLSHIDDSHPSLGYEYLKLATLYRQCGMRDDMATVARRALALLTLTCGDGHPNLEFVKNMLRK